MDTEKNNKQREGGLAIPGEAKRTKRLLCVSDKLLCVIENAIDVCLAEEDIPDKNTLKQFSALLKDIKDIQGILSPLEKEKQRAEVVLLRRKAEEESESDAVLSVFIEGDAAEYAK